MPLNQDGNRVHRFHPDDYGKRESFFMELLTMWENSSENLKQKGKRGKLAAEMFETAIKVLKMTYGVHELYDESTLFEEKNGNTKEKKLAKPRSRV